MFELCLGHLDLNRPVKSAKCMPFSSIDRADAESRHRHIRRRDGTLNPSGSARSEVYGTCRDMGVWRGVKIELVVRASWSYNACLRVHKPAQGDESFAIRSFRIPNLQLRYVCGCRVNGGLEVVDVWCVWDVAWCIMWLLVNVGMCTRIIRLDVCFFALSSCRCCFFIIIIVRLSVASPA